MLQIKHNSLATTSHSSSNLQWGHYQFPWVHFLNNYCLVSRLKHKHSGHAMKDNKWPRPSYNRVSRNPMSWGKYPTYNKELSMRLPNNMESQQTDRELTEGMRFVILMVINVMWLTCVVTGCGIVIPPTFQMLWEVARFPPQPLLWKKF